MTGGSGGGNNNNKNRCATVIDCSQRAKDPGGNLLSICLNANAEDDIDERGEGRDDIIKDGEQVIRRRGRTLDTARMKAKIYWMQQPTSVDEKETTNAAGKSFSLESLLMGMGGKCMEVSQG